MGDGSRWIADVDACPGDAPALARGILDWLVEIEAVAAEETDCVLGDVSGGHAPGPAYKAIVTRDDGPFPDVWPNGLEIDVGRAAFYGPMHEDDRVTCPLCGAWLPFEAVLPVAEDWAEEGGPDSLACARCGGRTGLGGWRWPVPCAFAELGFRFWNWPPLTGAFVGELARRLDDRVITWNPGHDPRI